MERNEQLLTRVDEETKRQFRMQAAARNMDMSELLRKIVGEYLEDHSEDFEFGETAQTAD
jgi:antitoxin component of RelBE/YafQ-DinJ toxin-antitoxin module